MGRILIACEFSGIVRDAFIAHGHDAHGASPLHNDDNTPVGAITIFEPVPQLESEDDLRNLYEHDARQLADVLVGCLPQGTIDQLTILLLEDKASLMRVVAPNRRRTT